MQFQSFIPTSYTIINQTHLKLSYLQSGLSHSPMNQEFKGQTILVDLLKFWKICITENSRLNGYVLSSFSKNLC